VHKNILRLALPNILSNISVPLLSTVDVVLMGHLSLVHLGAIGLSTMIFNFFFWNFGFLRMGTTGMVAQAFGANDEVRVNDLLSQSIYTALLISAVIIGLQWPIGRLSQYLLNVGDEHSALVWTYFSIRIWAAPATLVTYCLFGWLFGVQNAMIPMIITVVTNFLNITLSYYMVVILDWDMAGVAYGTVFAEYLGLLILGFTLVMRYQIRLVQLRQISEWMTYLRLNKDLFIRTIALTMAFGFFYRESSNEGAVVLATNVVMLQFLSWMSYGIDGFAFASESLVGRYYGARDRVSLLRVVRYSFIWASGLAMCFALGYGIFGTHLTRLFTGDIAVIDLMSSYRIWLIALPVIAFTCYIWDGIFIGLMESKKMRDSMLMSLSAYLLLYAILQQFYTNAIWISFALFLGVRGVILTIIWLRLKINL